MARKNGKDLNKQASALIKSRISIRNPNDTRTSNPGRYKSLQSIRSIKDTSYALAKIAKELGVKRIKHITPEMALEYLNIKRGNYASQKSLDRDRKALSIALQCEFPRQKAISDTELKSRAYTRNQVDEICKFMREKNALATQIAYYSGLRAHELITICRASEGKKTASRSWSEERFSGRVGDLYLVTGKGGLRREVLLPTSLVDKLEARRLTAPRLRTDRQVRYTQYYDIGGGNALSKSFSDASVKALGFSNGLHGVRHSYAQERLDEIKIVFRCSHDDARTILAEELGHFRGSITETYLR